MIFDILKILRNVVSGHLGDENAVVLGNIGKLDDTTSTDLNDKMVVTLLNAEEESTMKNKMHVTKNRSTNTYTKLPTPAYLNLYIMFASNRKNYERALQDISQVIAYFQNKPVFTHENTPNHNTDLDEFKFMVDLYSLPIEQLSYAWGVLGGKVLPSGLYKVSVIKVQSTNEEEGKLITDIERNITKKEDATGL